MINFNFSIRSPKVKWKTLWDKSGKTPFPNWDDKNNCWEEEL